MPLLLFYDHCWNFISQHSFWLEVIMWCRAIVSDLWSNKLHGPPLHMFIFFFFSTVTLPRLSLFSYWSNLHKACPWQLKGRFGTESVPSDWGNLVKLLHSPPAALHRHCFTTADAPTHSSSSQSSENRIERLKMENPSSKNRKANSSTVVTLHENNLSCWINDDWAFGTVVISHVVFWGSYLDHYL